jgi:hypothetical protein
LKRSFSRNDFLLKYHQNPSRNRAKKKKRKRKKAPRVSSNKGEVNILRWEKHFDFKNLF